MAVRLKIASDARELDDVYKLRHQVYVQERGKFGAGAEDDGRIVDHFDTIPDVVNVVAYADDIAIAAMRINKDSNIGLPAETYYNFSDIRDQLQKESNGNGVSLVSGSMLVIHKDWRNKRNVIFALFKTACGVMYSMGSSHVICSISEETLSLYGRIGFDVIAKSFWNEEVGDTLVPILAPFEKVFDWTFGQISKQVDHFWLDNFCGQFERLLLSPGEVLFNQDDTAEHTYAIDDGMISISRRDPEGNEMVLANLAKGALFGELAIFDGERRSAKATALINTELITIERSHMFDILRKNSDKVEQLLAHFSRRIRETDNLAMVQAFAPQTSRVTFALNQLWQSAMPDRKNPSQRLVKIGPEQIAKTARVREAEVRQVLERKKSEGTLDYGEKMLRFIIPPDSADITQSEAKKQH